MKIIYTIIFLLTISIDSYACSCIQVSTQEAYDLSDYVFQGNVLKVEDDMVTFNIEKIWKGNDDLTITLPFFSGQESLCGIGFAINEQYLIGGSDLEDLNLCSPFFSKLLTKRSTESVEALNAIITPNIIVDENNVNLSSRGEDSDDSSSSGCFLSSLQKK